MSQPHEITNLSPEQVAAITSLPPEQVAAILSNCVFFFNRDEDTQEEVDSPLPISSSNRPRRGKSILVSQYLMQALL